MNRNGDQMDNSSPMGGNKQTGGGKSGELRARVGKLNLDDLYTWGEGKKAHIKHIKSDG